MRDALAVDLADIGEHEIVVTVDSRFPFAGESGGAPIALEPITANGSGLDRLLDESDAVWLVAPETGGCLEEAARRVERRGKRLLGPGSEAIGVAADKAGLAARFGSAGVPYPYTVRLPPATARLRLGATPGMVAEALGGMEFPLVVKPRRGAGSEGVRWFADLPTMLAAIGNQALMADALAQEYVVGTPLSVSLLVDGPRILVLAVNSQELRFEADGGIGTFPYRGGITPFDHPEASLAAAAAVRACQSVPGLGGYIGVDLVLGPRGAVVIEINPRLTTAYLGVRRSVDGNVAAMAIAACSGVLPDRVDITRRVRFTEAGEIVSSNPIHSYAGGACR
jgi:predicted ATP-grasp superfamily ATP-dependent carboligase